MFKKGEKVVRKARKIVHTVRTADGGTKEVKNLTRTLAVKMLCTECLGFEGDPKECTSPMCPVWPFRRRTLATMRGDKK